MSSEIILTDTDLIETWRLGGQLAEELVICHSVLDEINSLLQFLQFETELNQTGSVLDGNEIKTYGLTGFFIKKSILYYKNYQNSNTYNLSFLHFNTIVSCAVLRYLNKEYTKENNISPIWSISVIAILLNTNFTQKLIFLLKKNSFLKEN